MESFKIDKTVDFSNPENIDRLLKEHTEFMESKFIKPNQEKLKEYENKINSYEEEKLFSNVNPKKADLIKNLMSTDKYKNLSKTVAFNQVNTDYKEFLNFEQKPNITTNSLANPKTLLDLHNNSTDQIVNNDELTNKVTTIGTKNELELAKYIELLKFQALSNIGQNFEKK